MCITQRMNLMVICMKSRPTMRMDTFIIKLKFVPFPWNSRVDAIKEILEVTKEENIKEIHIFANNVFIYDCIGYEESQ